MSDSPHPRRAVVSYPVNATEPEKARACMDGIRDCAAEAIGYGADVADVVAELEQVANDAEAGELI